MSLLWVAFGSLTHLVLDGMSRSPGTLLWVLYGWGFPRGGPSDWMEAILGVFREPSIGIPELAGALILAEFLSYLVHRRRLVRFLRTGAAG